GARDRAVSGPVQLGRPSRPPGGGVRVPQPVPGGQLGRGRRRAPAGGPGAAPVRGRPARAAGGAGPGAAGPARARPGVGPRLRPPGRGRAATPGGRRMTDRAPGGSSLSIVLPCLDEAERLPGTLAAYLAHFPPTRAEVELLVVDDGSTDGTTVIADQIAAADPAAGGGAGNRHHR